MRPVNAMTDPVSVRIGARVRASRQAQGMTLEKLAESAGVTRGFLSRLERDVSMPSVPTLVQICQALSLPIGSLFEAPEIQHVPLRDAPRINMGGHNVHERLITPRGEERVQVIRSSAAPGATGGESLYAINCDLEVLHVLSGTMNVRFPDQDLDLVPGDTLKFPGRTPHTWSAGPRGAELIWTLIPAAWSGSY